MKEREREKKNYVFFFLSTQRKTKRRFKKQSFKNIQNETLKEIGKHIILDEKTRKRDFHFFLKKRVVDSEKTQKQKKREKQKKKEERHDKKGKTQLKKKKTPKRKSSKDRERNKNSYF